MSLGQLGDPEVQELYHVTVVALFAQDNIFWLEVAMGDACSVYGVQSIT